MSAKDEETKNPTEEGDDKEDGTLEEEANKAEFKPLVELKEVPIVTMEEDENTVFKMRAKLFRFDQDAKQWKERGTGDVKFLQHKESKRIRLLMRREKTLKVCANHYIYPALALKENVSSDRSWMWTCPNDFADEAPSEEVFAIRFANIENATSFKKKFEECQEAMKRILDGEKFDLPKVEDKKDEPLEKSIEKLSVSDKNDKEEKSS